MVSILTLKKKKKKGTANEYTTALKVVKEYWHYPQSKDHPPEDDVRSAIFKLLSSGPWGEYQMFHEGTLAGSRIGTGKGAGSMRLFRMCG